MLQIARLQLLTCCFLVLLVSSAKVAAKDNWQDTGFVERAFIHVALRNEYSAGKKPLVKWQQPVKIWVQHKVGDQDLHDELVNAHIKHLNEIIGHPIYRVNTREEANVVWIFTQQKDWGDDIKKEMGKESAKHMFGAVCQAGYKTNPKTHEIISATVVIPVDQARSHGKLVACIVEEITQTLGLPNDSEFAYPSIFNDKTPEDLLSPLDVVLLKLLYEPELKTGMTEAQARPIIKKLIMQYQQKGLLAQALKDSQSSPLYQWFR